MPGISIVYKFKESRDGKINYTGILNSLNYFENYFSEKYLEKGNLFIGSTRYKEYPVRTFESGEYLYIVEGKIYNKTDSLLNDELCEISNSFWNLKAGKLSDWLLKTDGDFLICFVNKKEDSLYIINDLFGRIPFYFRIGEDEIILSRYLKFIAASGSFPGFDRIALAEFFLLGYPVGGRTILEGINQMRPGSLIRIEGSRFTWEQIFQFDFGVKLHKERNFDDNIRNLSELFGTGCSNRLTNNLKNIVTLSGGLDSRTVAACMSKFNLPYTAATISYTNGYAKEEIQIAEKLSGIFKADFKVLDVVPPKGKDLYSHLKIKEGMNSLSTAAMLPFYYTVKNFYGPDINLLMGDNGDKIMFTIDKPVKRFKSVHEVAEYIIGQHSIINIEKACFITGIDEENLVDDLINVLKSFPENDLVQKYIHYRALEKPHKYAFQGEDRHRHFFWHLSPFWSVPFFNYIMNCSDEIKIKHRLFGALLCSFSPEAAGVTYSNFKSPISSLRGKLFINAVYNLYPLIPSGLRDLLKSGFFMHNPGLNETSPVFKCILDQIEKSGITREYLKISKEDLKTFRKVPLLNILTISSAIEDFLAGRSSLLNYYNEEMV